MGIFWLQSQAAPGHYHRTARPRYVARHAAPPRRRRVARVLAAIALVPLVAAYRAHR